ncbi:MAG: hypothetical protein WC777_05145 [Candidatus Gracilibacteria bacterium]
MALFPINAYYSQGKRLTKVIDMTNEQKYVYGRIFQSVQTVLKKGFHMLSMEIPKKM